MHQRKYHDKGLSQAKEKIARCEELYKLRDEEAKELTQCQKSAEQHNNQGNKDFIAKREEVFRKIHGVHPKEMAETAIKKETDKIRQSLTNTNKDNSKKKGDSKQATTDKTKETNKNNNKTKNSQQWAI